MSELAFRGANVELTFTPELVEAIVELVLPHALERLADLHVLDGNRSDYLTVSEAAAFLRAKPQRVYDLTSAGRIRRYKDGTRLLVLRSELEAYLAGDALPRRCPPPLKGAH